MLGFAGAWVRDVEFGERAMIVTVALRRKRPLCSGCGARRLKIKDHRVTRWRHLDVGGVRCVIECRVRRLYCPGCGDLPEMVEWARGGARYTCDFDDLTAWLAQQMSQTQVTRLMRIGWETVGNILERVVAEKLPAGRLDGLELIGVDEVSYGADHKFLTCVANHETGGIVWAAPGRNAASLQAFFDGLSDEQKASIKRSRSTCPLGMRTRSARPRASRTPWCALTPSMSCSSVARPPTRSAATSTTATAAPQPVRASGSRARATAF
jgi:transposase